MEHDSLPRRGRPRAFDRDLALRKAMETFWEHGYERTSMLQLVEAMGIGSPSIYNAFGSKRALFEEAVNLYIATEANKIWQVLEQTNNAQLAIEALLLSAIDAIFTSEPPRGCLVVLSVAQMSGADKTVRAFLRQQRHRLLERLESRLNRGILDGELHPGTNTMILAECVMAFFSGLVIEAVDGVPKIVLRQSIETFCSRLFPA